MNQILSALHFISTQFQLDDCLLLYLFIFCSRFLIIKAVTRLEFSAATTGDKNRRDNRTGNRGKTKSRFPENVLHKWYWVIIINDSKTREGFLSSLLVVPFIFIIFFVSLVRCCIFSSVYRFLECGLYYYYAMHALAIQSRIEEKYTKSREKPERMYVRCATYENEYGPAHCKSTFMAVFNWIINDKTRLF